MSRVTLSFFVKGRPQPEAKKKMRQSRGYERPRLFSNDPDGRKRAWMENVRLCARRAMYNQGKIKIIPAGVGVTVKYQFYFEQAKSNKDEEMVIKPDSSRLAEAIDDALEGVCYKNDMQINRRLGGDKHYCKRGEAEGVMIEIRETWKR